jgi:phosphoribosylcarboxyaminoimidazole (NCAIR) mutase
MPFFNAQNAALLSVQILALQDKVVAKKFKKYKESLSSKVHKDRKKLSKLGVKSFLKS